MINTESTAEEYFDNYNSFNSSEKQKYLLKILANNDQDIIHNFISLIIQRDLELIEKENSQLKKGECINLNLSEHSTNFLIRIAICYAIQVLNSEEEIKTGLIKIKKLVNFESITPEESVLLKKVKKLIYSSYGFITYYIAIVEHFIASNVPYLAAQEHKNVDGDNVDGDIEDTKIYQTIRIIYSKINEDINNMIFPKINTQDLNKQEISIVKFEEIIANASCEEIKSFKENILANINSFSKELKPSKEAVHQIICCLAEAHTEVRGNEKYDEAVKELEYFIDDLKKSPSNWITYPKILRTINSQLTIM